MRTTIEIDDALLEQAKKVAGTQTKKETVELALAEMIRRKKAKRLLLLEGKVSLSFDRKELIRRRKKDVPDR